MDLTFLGPAIKSQKFFLFVKILSPVHSHPVYLKVSFLVSFCFLSFISLGQSSLGADSSLLNSKKGKDLVDYLNLTATSLRESDHPTTLAMSFKADSIAITLNDLSARSRANENIGWVYYRQSQWQKAFEYASKAYDFALSAKDTLQAARLMNNMGALYYEQQNFPKAIEQFKKGFEYATKVKDLQTQIRSLNNVALNFTQSGQQDSAMYYARISVSLNENAGSPYLTSFAHRVIGDVYLAKGQYDSAQAIYNRSLDMARQQGIISFETGILHRLGNAYLLDNKLSQAKEILDYSIELCATHGYPTELALSHKYLAKVFEQQGKISEAYKHLNTYLVLNDSINSKANRDRLALLQGMFEQNLQQSELELLKAQNESQSFRLATSRKYIILISIAVALISFLVVWMYFLNRKVSAKNKDLQLQQNKIAEQNKILENQSRELGEINETKNKLFSILGHDLRGPIGQVKSVIDLMISDQLDENEFLELIHVLQKDINSVNFTINNILKWSMSQMDGFTLHPSTFSLKATVDNSITLLNPAIVDKKLTVFNQISGDMMVHTDQDLADVIIRNILNNSIKFSKPGDAVTIFAEKVGKFIELCVMDQGVGMDPALVEKILSDEYSITKSTPGTKKEKGSGLGLQLVKEFVKKIGGELFIQSVPNHGTRFCVKIPASIN